MNLPVFKYHPDPLTTGSVIYSDTRCRCCGEQRGYIYTSSVYCIGEIVREICPWCIADGSAAEKFGATFVDDYYLIKAGINASIIEEITRRTPGFDSWQAEMWLSHCQDACTFLGDATKQDVVSIADEQIQVTGGEGIDSEIMNNIAENYVPKSSPAFYKFMCLHCGKILYAIDYD